MAYAQAIELDKLYYFLMASDQPNPVLIIRSPTDNKAIKQFLGYDWSTSKGDEGIKLIKDAKGHHLTPLYDETDRSNAAKLNRYIADNFNGTLTAIPEALSLFAHTMRLVDMLDFSRPIFEKQVGLVSQKSPVTLNKWPLAKLESVAEIVNGGTPDTNAAEFWKDGNICWATLVDTKEKYLVDTKRKITSAGLKHTNLLPINTVIFSSRATIGEVCINKVPTATNQGYKNFVCNPSRIHHEYLYYLLVHLRPVFESLVPSGSKYKEINTKTIREYEIPLPLLALQQQIVTECVSVDTEVAVAKTKRSKALDEIEMSGVED